LSPSPELYMNPGDDSWVRSSSSASSRAVFSNDYRPASVDHLKVCLGTPKFDSRVST
jgi:hypothetical protein